MRKVLLLIAACVALGLSSTARAQETALTCEDYRCQFQQRLLDECNCSSAGNHGRYVSCVAHLIKSLVDEGMPVNCKGKLQRCAARSVCGKQDRGFQTCTTFEYSTCNIDPILLTGTCANDPLIACTTNTDCVISQRCKITRHAESCAGAGQFLNLSPTCCSNCVAPVEPTPAP